MNKDTPPFTRDEVLQATRSLTGKPSDLNHDHTKMQEGVKIEAAQFEDDCVECVCRVPKTSSLVGMIQRSQALVLMLLFSALMASTLRVLFTRRLSG